VSALDLARWQFGITTVYHFLFVPLTIGLAPMVAILQTAWHRTGDDRWLRMTKFFGTAFLINFAIGVVTGIVQEFQFGMNWSRYSIFVGDVFGAPLALEALIAFFLESVFLGAWIFGWGRLPKAVHLASIWLAAIGSNLSAYFIIAANSFMQHPVGTHVNPATGRAELDSIVAMLTNSTAVVAFTHTVTASFVTAGTFMAGLAGWWMVRAARIGGPQEAATYRPALRLALVVLLLAGTGVAATGDQQAKVMFAQQPMKMAAAEALCHTEKGASFSVLSIGDLKQGCTATNVLAVPGLTSFLATGDPNATVKGVEELRLEAVAAYGPSGVDGSGYVPMVALSYWSFRLMIGLGVGAALLAVAGLWATRGGRAPTGSRFGLLALLAIPTPFLANIAGWVFTEMGRQPWIVSPNPTGDPQVRLPTSAAVSPFVDRLALVMSLGLFTALYGVLALVWFSLMRRQIRAGAPQTEEHLEVADDAPLTFAY
jgi:cytochrome bd ubiquinol oxidase subunit I